MNVRRQPEPVLLADARSALAVPGVGRLMRLLLALGVELRRGGAIIDLPDGRRFRVGGGEPGPLGHIAVGRPRVARRALFGGNIGFAESYLDGDWETPDLTALLEMLALNCGGFAPSLLHGWPLAKLLNRLLHRLRDNHRAGSRRNIAFHYDMGNDFYGRWLDPSMTYSGALFAGNGGEAELAAAQGRKYARIAEIGDIRPEHHVLEIGCGWGGFAEFAAGEIGCRVTAVTLSREQYDYAAERIQRAGLAERVAIRLEDYRDVAGRFDRIASIEMLEAVGERYWPLFFRRLHDLLSPGGKAALQVITIAEQYFEVYRNGTDFIQRYIFPGGMLPTDTALRREAGRAGLRWLRDDGFAGDYARTLAHWRARFLAAWPDLAPLGYDERFRRLWQYYLCYCEAGFRSDTIDLRQIALVRD